MKLSSKCACGATFEGEAEKGSLQTPDLMDAYQRWLTKHADHAAMSRPSDTPSVPEQAIVAARWSCNAIEAALQKPDTGADK